jgi:hypothetical protein
MANLMCCKNVYLTTIMTEKYFYVRTHDARIIYNKKYDVLQYTS